MPSGKIDADKAKQIAMAAAQGVAIALSHRGTPKEEFFIPPHIICGIPPFIFEVPLRADAEGKVVTGSAVQSRG
jgi:hypothetical protein